MKTTLRCLGLDAHATWQSLVIEQLHRLKSLTDIESAEVILERQRDSSPAYRARMLLMVPGPDYHADAMDYTLTAALHKIVEDLARQIRARQTKHVEQRKSRLQLSTISSHRPGTFAGQRA
jgi:ribosome-associated translation inhibitor RaiA